MKDNKVVVLSRPMIIPVNIVAKGDVPEDFDIRNNSSSQEHLNFTKSIAEYIEANADSEVYVRKNDPDGYAPSFFEEPLSPVAVEACPIWHVERRNFLFRNLARESGFLDSYEMKAA
jgi:hypothetical protein